MRRLARPVCVWKQSRPFVLQHDPLPLHYGWTQFRIFLYMAGFFLVIVILGRLSPKRPEELPGMGEAIAGCIFMPALLTYGATALTYYGRSMVALHPAYLVRRRFIFERYFRFSLISRYEVEEQNDGWLLRLVDLDAKEMALLQLPDLETKANVELVLNKAGVTRNALSGAETARRREMDEALTQRVSSYRRNSMRYEKTSGFWFVGTLLLSLGLAVVMQLFFRADTGAGFAVLMLVVLIVAHSVASVRMRKKWAKESGLSCPHCKALELNPTFMRTLAATHSCVYCGERY